MNKRGTHIAVMISFAIFIAFVVFLIIFLEPQLRIQKARQSYLDYLKIALERMFIGEMIVLTLNLTESEGRDCISLKDSVASVTAHRTDSTHLIFKNETNGILDYRSSGSNDLLVKTGVSNRGILKIYYSEKLSTTYCGSTPSPECNIAGCIPTTNYDITMIRVSNETFEPKIEEVVEWYNDDYEDLKNSLQIPPGMNFEFSFDFEDNEGNIVAASQPIPVDRDVYVQENPILYIDEWGNLKPGNLILKVWEVY